MPSVALTEWRTTGLQRLRELENVHTLATGSEMGRRWGTAQLNRALFVTLVAQFQAFARGLHDESVEVHLGRVDELQRPVLLNLMTRGRKLTATTPRMDSLGADFGLWVST